MWGAVTNQQGNGVIYFTRWEKKQILLNSYDAMERAKGYENYWLEEGVMYTEG